MGFWVLGWGFELGVMGLGLTQNDLHEQQKFVKRWIRVWIIDNPTGDQPMAIVDDSGTAVASD